MYKTKLKHLTIFFLFSLLICVCVVQFWEDIANKPLKYYETSSNISSGTLPSQAEIKSSNLSKEINQSMSLDRVANDPIYDVYSNYNYCPFSISIPKGFKGFLYAPPPAPNHGFFVLLKNNTEASSKERCDYEKGEFIFADVTFYVLTENERDFDKVISKDVEYTVGGLKDEGIAAKLVSTKNFNFSKCVAKRAIFTYKSNLTNQEMIFDKIIALGLTKEGTVSCIFSLGLIAPERSYKEYLPLFDYMISSWQEIKKDE